MNFKQGISIGTSIVLLTSSLYSESWSSTQNQHGFILKSDDTTLYLGKSCDATSPQYGTSIQAYKHTQAYKHRGQVNVIVLTASFYNPINR